MLNPITHSLTPQDVARYRVEPYVAVGDVYSAPAHLGRGGWTWYSGSAGWLHRAGTEWLLGLRVRGARLMIDPCIPAAWPGFTATVRHASAQYEVVVENPGAICRGVKAIELDGAPLPDRGGVPLANDGRTHRVRVVMGQV
jgi:cyclic beta-1,2-glucan synthetase